MKQWTPPPTAQKRSRQTASAILWALHMGGDISSPGGNATKILERRMRALDLWRAGSAKNFLFIATQLSTDKWGKAIDREVTPGRRCIRLGLNLRPDELPPPPVGWSAKDAILKMETISEAEIDRPARSESLKVSEGRWVWPSGMRSDSREAVRAILWTLHDLGGTVHSKEGYASRVLLDQVAKHTSHEPDATTRYLLSRLYGEYEGEEYFGRVMIAKQGNSKRIFQIDLLVDEEDLPNRPDGVVEVDDPTDEEPEQEQLGLAELEPEEPPTANGSARTAEFVVEPVEVSDEDDPIDLILSAQRMMTRAVLAVSSRRPMVVQEDSDDVVLRRLHDALEEGQRWRRKAAEANAAYEHRAQEVDTLKRVLAETQANLDAIRGRAIAESSDTDRLMRQVPRSSVRR